MCSGRWLYPLPTEQRPRQWEATWEGSLGVGEGGQQAGTYLGFTALQPVMKEGVVGTADVGGKGILPDCGVRGLVQVGQVLEGALAKALQGCSEQPPVESGLGLHTRCLLYTSDAADDC